MVEVMVLSEKEREMILKSRAEDERQEKLRLYAKELRAVLQNIEDLGGSVGGEWFGGKYERYQQAKMTVGNVKVYCH